MSFMTAAFVIQLARGNFTCYVDVLISLSAIRRNFRPFFVITEGDKEKPKPTKKLYDLVCVICTSFTLNYTMTPFCVST